MSETRGLLLAAAQAPPPHEPLIHVSTPHLLLSIVPLFLLAGASYSMDLGLESPILVGTIRAFVQLSILGMILEPIFIRGLDWWWLVIAYVCFMVTLATLEAVKRPKYYFHNMTWFVFGLISINITLVSLFAFGIILQPTPLWDPRYVIPIIGMLLGNCINGLALALNSILTGFVESAREVELYLSFGANSYEASLRLRREAVRTGAMPQLNGMAIIGLVSIPGMMTGQILGGAPVTEAARYQMLIIYFISMVAFGTILSGVYLAVRIGFDQSSSMQRTDRLFKRVEQPWALWAMTTSFVEWVQSWWDKTPKRRRTLSHDLGTTTSAETSYLAPKGELVVSTLQGSTCTASLNAHRPAFFQASNMACSFAQPVVKKSRHDDDEEQTTALKDESSSLIPPPLRHVLFRDLHFGVAAGEMALVSGPSGVGKSTLLRILAGLVPCDDGILSLDGTLRSELTDMCLWRKHVRYVTQSKVDIPGTPYDFLKRVSAFGVWNRTAEASVSPSYHEMKATTRALLQGWGMPPGSQHNYLDKDWSTLSGGEAQRVLVALAMASRPQVLLLDESTSALDLDTKMRVEQSIAKFCKENSISALIITHDEDQMERIQKTTK
jgi:putative ABC transport system permease protein